MPRLRDEGGIIEARALAELLPYTLQAIASTPYWGEDTAGLPGHITAGLPWHIIAGRRGMGSNAANAQ